MPSTTSILFTTPPETGEAVMPLDTTRLITGDSRLTSMAAGSADRIPAARRGAYAEKDVIGAISVTGYAVDVFLQLLTGNAGADADWVTAFDGYFRLDAGDSRDILWRPMAVDYRIIVQAVSTKPTALVVNLCLTDRR
jgi:hypothetical protein